MRFFFKKNPVYIPLQTGVKVRSLVLSYMRCLRGISSATCEFYTGGREISGVFVTGEQKWWGQ